MREISNLPDFIELHDFRSREKLLIRVAAVVAIYPFAFFDGCDRITGTCLVTEAETLFDDDGRGFPASGYRVRESYEEIIAAFGGADEMAGGVE